MPHKNIYLENEEVWRDIKKIAMKENKTLNGLIEEILIMYISDKKSKALTPEKMAFYIKNNFAKGKFVTTPEIVAKCCDGLFISERRLKSYLKDLQLNNVVIPARSPKMTLEDGSRIGGIDGFKVV